MIGRESLDTLAIKIDLAFSLVVVGSIFGGTVGRGTLVESCDQEVK